MWPVSPMPVCRRRLGLTGRSGFNPKGAGALFTVQLKGGYDACVKLVDSLQLFSHVANLGDARSLIIHSASTTHRQLTPEQQMAAGARARCCAPFDRDRRCGGYHRRSGSGAGKGSRIRCDAPGNVTVSGASASNSLDGVSDRNRGLVVHLTRCHRHATPGIAASIRMSYIGIGWL